MNYLQSPHAKNAMPLLDMRHFAQIRPLRKRPQSPKPYYRAWLADSAHYQKQRKRLSNLITLWQAKHAMLRHENNKLRRKLYPKK